MATTKFLTPESLTTLLGILKEAIQKAPLDVITTALDENSTDITVPGAKTVYDFVMGKIGGLANIKLAPVTELPTTDIDPSTIYLLEIESTAKNDYSMHIYSNGTWYDLGLWQVDLTGYWSKDELTPITDTEIQDIWDNLD